MRRVSKAIALTATGVLMLIPTPWAQAAAPSAVISHTQTSATVVASTVAFTAFAPKKGTMGIKVIITGTGFMGTTKVAFHGVSATFKVISNTRIAAIVPCGATSGRLTVITPNGKARSVGTFKFT